MSVTASSGYSAKVSQYRKAGKVLSTVRSQATTVQNVYLPNDLRGTSAIRMNGETQMISATITSAPRMAENRRRGWAGLLSAIAVLVLTVAFGQPAGAAQL